MQNSFVKAAICCFIVPLVACAPKPASGSITDPTEERAGVPPLPMSVLTEVIREGVPSALADMAFLKYKIFSSQITNGSNLAIVDFTLRSDVPRFYLIDATTGHVDKLLVAHGSGSDPKATGLPTVFSNVPNSLMSSLGAYLVSEEFQSTDHGTAARLDGLEATNNLARNRGIILHSASYVNANLNPLGMSWGCPAVALNWIAQALARLSGGGFLYIYGQGQSQTLDEQQILSLMTNPAYRWVNESEEAPVDGVF